MTRFADVFVALCIVVIALSVGMIVWTQTGLGIPTAIASVLGGMLALGAVQGQLVRIRDRRAIDRQLDQVARSIATIQGELVALDRRVGAMEVQARRPQLDPQPMVEEIEILGTIVKQIAETVAEVDERLVAHIASTRAKPVAPAAATVVAAPSARAEPALTPVAKPAAKRSLVPDRFGSLGDMGFKALIEDAIGEERIEINLQPIVGLPQRKPRFYDVAVRLKTVTGDAIEPAEYRAFADAHRLSPRLDTLVLARGLVVLKRLVQRTPEMSVLVPISAASWLDARFFRDTAALLDTAGDHCGQLIIDMPFASLHNLGAIERDAVRELVEKGARFSLSGATTLALDGRQMGEIGVRAVRVPAATLFAPSTRADIHPQDVATLMQRSGVDFIVSDIELEAQIPDLIDYGVRFAQGHVIGAPRPVRADVLAFGDDAPTQASTPAPTRQGVSTVPTRPIPRTTGIVAASDARPITAPPVVAERRPAAATAVPPPPVEAAQPDRREGMLRDVLRRVDPRTARTRSLAGNS
jgi:cyclic-di-GMP phosphodiesterase TipF (flagellum assembly factor)